jgi:hypothetical protein
LRRDEAACAALDRFDRDIERIVQTRGRKKVDLESAHDKSRPKGLFERGQRKPKRREPFGSRSFHELEVIGVVDDAGRVGVFVIDAHGKRERGLAAQLRHSLGKRSAAAPGTGGASPK